MVRGEVQNWFKREGKGGKGQVNTCKLSPWVEELLGNFHGQERLLMA